MPKPLPEPLAQVVTEPELRRYLRSASTLLACAEPPMDAVQRLAVLRRARSWAHAALDGIDQLVADAERAIESTDDEPLTVPLRPARIEGDP